MTDLDEDAVNTRHNAKMQKFKAAHDKLVAGKTIEKGLLIVHTGTGKGKTTAALGMVCRAIGHGFKVGVVQFVKGAWETGEMAVLNAFPNQVTVKVLGGGFTWDTQDRAKDIELARHAWEEAKAMIRDPSIKLVLCDELNIVLRYDYLPLDEVVEFLRDKPEDKHVIVTGRNARAELIDAADLVTEMTMVKHPFRKGVKAQAGIEF